LNEIKEIDANTLGKILALISIIPVVLGVVISLVTTNNVNVVVLFQPLGAYLGGFIIGSLYNIIAMKFGGIKVRLVETDE